MTALQGAGPEMSGSATGNLCAELEALPPPRCPPVADIKVAVAEHFSLTQQELIGGCRARQFARPRQVAMYLACRLTLRSLPEIGALFGNRDHTTVMHARRTVTDLLTRDAELAAAVKSITAVIDRKMDEAA